MIANLIQIRENQLQVDDINIWHWVNFPIHMNNIIILKTANNLKEQQNNCRIIMNQNGKWIILEIKSSRILNLQRMTKKH